MPKKKNDIEKAIKQITKQYNTYWKDLIEAVSKETGLDTQATLVFLNLFVTNSLAQAVYNGNEANKVLRERAMKMLEEDVEEGEEWKSPEDEEEEK